MLLTILPLLISTLFGFLLSTFIVRDAFLGERLALGYGLGLCATTFLMFGLAILKVPIREHTMVPVVLIVLGALSIIIWRRLYSRETSKQATNGMYNSVSGDIWFVQASKYCIIAGISLIVMLTLVNAAYWPVYSWDSLTEYDFRGRAFILTGDLSILALNYYYGGLPIHTSLAHSWIYLWSGDAIHLIYWLYYVGLLLGLYYCIKSNISSRLSSLVALLFTLVLAYTPIIAAHSGLSFANLPFAYYYSIGTFYLYIWTKTMRTAHIILASIMLGMSSWVRAGAEPYFLISALVILIWCFFQKQWKPGFYFFAFLALAYLPWKIYQSQAIPQTNQLYETMIVFEFDMQRAKSLLGLLIEFFIRSDLFGLIWPLFFVLVVCSLAFGKDRSLILLFIVLADLSAWYAQFYLTHAGTLEYFTRGSGDRLLMTYAPVALLYCAVCPALRLIWEVVPEWARSWLPDNKAIPAEEIGSH